MIHACDLQYGSRAETLPRDGLTGLRTAICKNPIGRGKGERGNVKVLGEKSGGEVQPERGSNPLDALHAHLRQHALGRGEVVVRQGDPQAHRTVIHLTGNSRTTGYIPAK